jgi:hypothetical protein
MLNGVIVGNKVEQQKATATHSTHSEAIEKSGRVAPDTWETHVSRATDFSRRSPQSRYVSLPLKNIIIFDFTHDRFFPATRHKVRT